jgi:hypothetical protein
MRARRWAGLACAATLCASLLAQAAAQDDAGPLVVTLDYAALPGCPDGSEFRAIVVGRLGYDPFRESAPNRVIARIVPRSPAYEGRIEWRDAQGKWEGDRTFPSRSADCRELVRAMAFALALQIQLSATASPHPDAGAPPPEETSTPAIAPAPPAPAPVTPPASSRISLTRPRRRQHPRVSPDRRLPSVPARYSG